MRPDELVIVADADDAGQRGAERLREALILVAPVRLIAPPDGIKDARQWVTSGADRASIEAAADAFPVMRLQWHGGAS
jgi:DNA primase